DYRDPGTLDFVFRGIKPSALNFNSADVLDLRVEPADGQRVRAVFALHRGIEAGFRGDVANQRHAVLDVLQVVQREAVLDTGLHAAGLHGASSGKDAHHLNAEVGKDVVDGAPETGAVSQQEHHRGDTPGHTQHGQGGAPAVVPQRTIGLSQQIVNHGYSFLR